MFACPMMHRLKVGEEGRNSWKVGLGAGLTQDLLQKGGA
jgi:hypothetical protein